jgi:benzoyl-CoA reductase/2-hydroxyglutaryl-CoA dehydratase subunit BcrC/BadD/HgdB
MKYMPFELWHIIIVTGFCKTRGREYLPRKSGKDPGQETLSKASRSYLEATKGKCSPMMSAINGHEGGGMSLKKARTVAYSCCYVPVEVIMAAGLKPERLIPQGRCSKAEGYIHPNTCFYVKSLFSDAMAGAFAHVDAVILANSCDAMRRLYDLWGAYVKSPAALFMDIPKKKDHDSIDLFTAELGRISFDLSMIPDSQRVTKGRLETGIKQMNHLRNQCNDLFMVMRSKPGCLTGSECFALLQDGPDSDLRGFSQKVIGILKREYMNTSTKNGPRILITGNMVNNPDLISMIESAGATVAGIDTCFGRKHYNLKVAEGTSDPLAAIAARYLLRPSCPRMIGIEEQILDLTNQITDTKAHGVIVSKIKFCDNLSYNIPVFQEAVAAAGARCLVLENDYEWSDIETLRIKVETFIEMLG